MKFLFDEEYRYVMNEFGKIKMFFNVVEEYWRFLLLLNWNIRLLIFIIRCFFFVVNDYFLVFRGENVLSDKNCYFFIGYFGVLKF